MMAECAFATETLLARKMNPWEKLPDELRLNFPKLDPDWIWVVDGHDGPVAALYGADLHGFAYLARLAVLPKAPSSVLVLLFRKMVSDLRERGYGSFMCWLSATRVPEMKLARLIQRLGGGLSAESGWFGAARIDGRTW